MFLLEFRLPKPQKSSGASKSVALRPGLGVVSALTALAFAMPAAAGAQHIALALHSADKGATTAVPVLLDAMTTELHRAFTSLGGKPQATRNPTSKCRHTFLATQ